MQASTYEFASWPVFKDLPSQLYAEVQAVLPAGTKSTDETKVRKRLCAWAASDSKIELLKWAHQHQFPFELDICSSAKSIEVLQTLRDLGAPLNEFATGSFSTSGRFDLLKWAHEHGWPIGAQVRASIIHTILLCSFQSVH